MTTLKHIRAFVRPEVLQQLLVALEQKGVPRVFVSEVMSIGAGVDPEDYRVSAEGGESYSRKKVVEFFCDAEDAEDLIALVRNTARTGHRGDGIVTASSAGELVNIRTGDRELLALV